MVVVVVASDNVFHNFSVRIFLVATQDKVEKRKRKKNFLLSTKNAGNRLM